LFVKKNYKSFNKIILHFFNSYFCNHYTHTQTHLHMSRRKASHKLCRYVLLDCKTNYRKHNMHEFSRNNLYILLSFTFLNI